MSAGNALKTKYSNMYDTTYSYTEVTKTISFKICLNSVNSVCTTSMQWVNSICYYSFLTGLGHKATLYRRGCVNVDIEMEKPRKWKKQGKCQNVTTMLDQVRGKRLANKHETLTHCWLNQYWVQVCFFWDMIAEIIICCDL